MGDSWEERVREWGIVGKRVGGSGEEWERESGAVGKKGRDVA